MITGGTTLKELREQMLDEDSEFYHKVKIRKDKKSVTNRIKVNCQNMDFFMAFVFGGISQKKESEGYKYCTLFSDATTPSTAWRQLCGWFLYDEDRIMESEKILIFKNDFNDESQLKDYIKLQSLFSLKKEQMDELEKVYNYFCDNGISTITLEKLRDDIKDENSEFSKWADGIINRNQEYFVDEKGSQKSIDDYDNDDLNSFMLLLAIILGGAATPKQIQENDEGFEYNGKEPRIVFLARCINKYGWNKSWLWHRICKAFLGILKGDDNIDFSKPGSPNDKMQNIKNNEEMLLIDLEKAFKDDDSAIKNLGYNVKDFFDKGLKDDDKNMKIGKLINQFNSLIDYLTNVNEGGDMNNKDVENLIKDNIENYNQVIFTGAPGTGKTHSVREYVKDKNYKFVQFHPSYDYSDFIEGLRPVTLDNNLDPTFARIDGVFKKFCRHIVDRNLKTIFKSWRGFNAEKKNKVLEFLYCISKNYTKILGLISDSENLKFKLDGLVNVVGTLRGLKDLESVKERVAYNEWCIIDGTMRDKEIDLSINDNISFVPYYFVVDEINRADLSKVFGEIMFGLEESYRGLENRFDTQYMNLKTFEVDENGKAKPMEFDCFEKGFFIPSNLKFVGTMNDIDRSVESFDFALRRRFKWIDIKANDVMNESLQSILNGKITQHDMTIDDLARRVINMNKIISGDIGKKLGLNEAFHIGPAYFKSFDGSKNKLEDIFNSNIESILREYTRGRREDEVKKFIEKCKIELLADLNKAENPQSQNIANNNPDVSGVNN